MTYIPRKNKKAQNISLALILVGVTVFALSGYVMYAAILQVVGVAAIVTGLQMLVRYVLTDHVYIIDDREDGCSDFVVIKRQGKREIKVCHISVFAIEDVCKRSERTVKSAKRYNYVQNLGAKPYAIMFRDGETLNEVLIEADDSFVSVMRERMGGDGSGTVFAM